MNTMYFERYLLESLKKIKSRSCCWGLSTYRTEADAEVDFILERDSDVFAIEVKSSRKFHTGDLRGLKSFAEFYAKKHHSLLIYQGENELEVDGVKVLPLVSAMKMLGYA